MIIFDFGNDDFYWKISQKFLIVDFSNGVVKKFDILFVEWVLLMIFFELIEKCFIINDVVFEVDISLLELDFVDIVVIL